MGAIGRELSGGDRGLEYEQQAVAPGIVIKEIGASQTAYVHLEAGLFGSFAGSRDLRGLVGLTVAGGQVPGAGEGGIVGTALDEE
jgi:hypothetical protein